jgi:signal transduction histidine kinase
VGQKVDEILDFHPGLLESYQQGKAHLGEIQPGGAESRWYDFSVSALKDGVRQPIGRLLTISDITERKRAEEALALARDQAMQASLFKSQLLGKVSHELHTPLVAIQGYSELMRYGTFGVLTEKQIEATDQIIASVKYLNGIVNDLLEEAQISAQKTVLRVEPFSLPVLLRYVEANLSAQASRKGLEFSLKVARTLPEILYGDEGRLRQILLNLAGNAIKFTGAGRVCMEVDRLDPAQWMVRVTDTGVGIPPESIADIFEPFRQVQTALSGGDEGTGLGLTITRQLVEMMGGKIMVESQLGLGSTFTIVLPLIENLERPRAVATGLDL